MGVARGLRFAAGESGPRQQSPVACGAACLVVARMMIDPAFTAWVRGAPDRFARAEREVHVRTNAVNPAPGDWQLPWPTGLGTPPWGARWELEHGAAEPGTGYALRLLRDGVAGRRAGDGLAAVAERVEPGRPAPLYVGNAWSPRHVTLLFRDEDHPGVRLYDPADGRVGAPPAGPRGTWRRSGWDTAWFAVAPTGEARVRAGAASWHVERSPVPVVAPGLARERSAPTPP